MPFVRVERWKKAVGFDERLHGTVVAATANGDSGKALDTAVSGAPGHRQVRVLDHRLPRHLPTE